MLTIVTIYLAICIICNALDHLKIVSDDRYFSSYANFIDEIRDEYTISKLHRPILSKLIVIATHLFFFITLPIVALVEWVNGGSDK